MTDPTETSLSTIAEESGGGVLGAVGEWLGGIPKALQRPFLKAAGRLVTGIAEVPAAFLEAKVKDINHQQEIKEKMRSAFAEQAIAKIPDSPEIAERALHHFAADVLGKQFNREEVVRHAAEELAQGAQQAQNTEEDLGTAEALDDDWLNSFSQYAEKASTDRMQSLFGRVLAGEIRYPGKYSLFAVDLLSKIGKKDAEAITSIAPFVVRRNVIRTKSLTDTVPLDSISRLINLGLMSALVGDIIPDITLKIDRDDIFKDRYCGIILSSRNIIFFTSPSQTILKLNCYVLTDLGNEILSLHVCDVDAQMLKDIAEVNKGTEVTVHIADLVNPESITDSGPQTVRWANERGVYP